jgi:hypothetical protein
MTEPNRAAQLPPRARAIYHQVAVAAANHARRGV